MPDNTKDRRLEELEAQAVDQAKASADAAFRPAPSVFNAPTADILLQQVDGPSLQTYQGTESVYVGRSVPVAAGGTLNIPIHVSTPGSVVAYAVELKALDIYFSITAEREEGVTIVKEKTRIYATDDVPITQKFLVGTVPCLLQFDFRNDYSWLREKVVSYKITVTPPSKESLAAGRRRRAQACLQAVEDDLATAVARCAATAAQKAAVEREMATLQQALADAQQAQRVAEQEERWLRERQALRVEQQKLLQQRLTHGWPDEGAARPNGGRGTK